MYDYKQFIEKELISEEQIKTRVKELAREIEKEFKGEKILLVCILRGSFMFFADLVRELNLEAEIDFMAISTYGSGARSTGKITIVKDIKEDIKGKNVLIVEDIIDSGHTLTYLKQDFLAREPKKLKICSFLDKKERREVEIDGDFIGFDIPNEFVIGYGLDYAEQFRTLKSVCILKREVYEK